MCQHSYEYEGYRSFGDNIPGYAQGAYFPGDEPGTRCELTGEACGNICGDAPHTCAAIDETDWPCPFCATQEHEQYLYYDERDGFYHCPDCNGKHTLKSLPLAYDHMIGQYEDRISALIDERQHVETENKRLREQIDDISEIIDVMKQAH